MKAQQKNVLAEEHDEIERIIHDYADSLFRLCFTILRNSADAEDAVSETLLKYLTRAPVFLDENHRKAWLMRVAVNTSRDMLRSRNYREHLDLREVCFYAPEEPDNGILEAVLRLPEKYRTVLCLYYIEGYTSEEIGKILSISPSAVRKRMQYGRKKLKLEYEKEE